jgi:hypothetical protein
MVGANVNVWGPHLWSLLHGLAGLIHFERKTNNVNVETYARIATMLQNLKILLPCIHCRESYTKFYDLKNGDNVVNFGLSDDLFAWVFELHNLVNEKLLLQRVGELSVECQTLGSRETFRKIMNIPDYQVVVKRYLISDKHPFSEESVWIVLASFCLQVSEHKNDYNDYVQRIASFSENLAYLLSLGNNYDEIQIKLSLFSENLSLYFSKSPLDLLVLCKTSNLNEKLVQNLNLTNENQKIRNYYTELIPAGSCVNLTCV